MNGENSKILADCMDELLGIQKWIKEGKNIYDPKAKYLISYCIIKACGTIERTYKNTVFDTISKGVSQETSNYLTSLILEGSSNPSISNMCNLLKRISEDWNTSFKSSCTRIDKSNLDSLVKLRNSFSHGTNVTVSIENIIEYYESSILVVEELYKTIN